MKLIKMIISLTTLFLFFPSCGPNNISISGEIFIVTKGRENIKLGLVEVYAIDDKFMDDFLNRLEKKRKNATEKFEQNRKPIPSLIGGGQDELLQAKLLLEQELHYYKVLRKHLHQSFLENIPTPVASTKTNSDGKYKLIMPYRLDIVLIATAKREVGENTEYYYWTKKIDKLDKNDIEVNFSNDSIKGIFQILDEFKRARNSQ